MRIKLPDGTTVPFNNGATITSNEGEELLHISMEQSIGPCVLSVITDSSPYISLPDRKAILADKLMIHPRVSNCIHIHRPIRNV